MCRKNLARSAVCRVYGEEDEKDTLHVLSCGNKYLSNYRNKVINLLQLKVMQLQKTDIIPLSILKVMLLENHADIEEFLAEINHEFHELNKRKL